MKNSSKTSKTLHTEVCPEGTLDALRELAGYCENLTGAWTLHYQASAGPVNVEVCPKGTLDALRGVTALAHQLSDKANTDAWLHNCEVDPERWEQHTALRDKWQPPVEVAAARATLDAARD